MPSIRRRVAAALALVLGSGLALVAQPAMAADTDIEINEVATNLPGVSDWIELVNTGAAPVDLGGWIIKDDDDEHVLPIAGGTSIPAGGFLQITVQDVPNGFGLGNGDQARLFLPDGLTLIDEHAFPSHGNPTWAACPDGSDTFQQSFGATPGGPNACVPAAADFVVLNEVESSAPNSGTDWVELFNTASAAADVSGLVIDDGTAGGGTTIPAGTSIPAGGFLAIDTSGLGGDDAARLLATDGTTVIDEYVWGPHADETYGRCPDGTGPFLPTESATKGAANHCPTPGGIDDIVINEVESNGDPSGDWVELFNTGAEPVDLTGWWLRDNDVTEHSTLPAGTILQPQSFVVVEAATLVFGLGGNDEVNLFAPDGTLVEQYAWPVHASTSYGRCPDGTGGFLTTFASSKGAGNICSPIRINEVESQNGAPGDWIELTNAGSAPVDVAGYVLRDSNDAAGLVLPAAVIPAGGFVAVEVDVAGGFGLGGSDSARLFAADGTTLLDSTSWTAHAASTFGRCPDGTGLFEETDAVTKGAANDCGIVPPEAWPGPDGVRTVDTAAQFGEDMSGLVHEAGFGRGTLWAVNNGDGVLFRLTWNGTAWVPETGEWADGAVLTYPGGAGVVDAEGVGITAAGSAGGVYVASERNNDANQVSRPSVLRFDVTAGAGTLPATHEWNLAALLPAGIGANAGLEGITWIPDAVLTAQGFLDESTNAAYDPAAYGPHAGGVFVVALEATGDLYAVVLEDDGEATLVATIQPELGLAAEVTFEPETGDLWAICDEACDGRTATLAVAQEGPFDGRFRVTHVFDNPAGMTDTIANEGFAFAPLALCFEGLKPVWYADDADTEGFALREAQIECGPRPQPPAPAESTLTAATRNVISGPASATPGQTVTLTVGATLTDVPLDAWVLSAPAFLGTRMVSAAGTIAVTIPADAATGTHRLAVYSTDGTIVGWITLAIGEARLGNTGADGAGLALPIALSLLVVGAAAVAVVRRRQPRSSAE